MALSATRVKRRFLTPSFQPAVRSSNLPPVAKIMTENESRMLPIGSSVITFDNLGIIP